MSMVVRDRTCSRYGYICPWSYRDRLAALLRKEEHCRVWKLWLHSRVTPFWSTCVMACMNDPVGIKHELKCSSCWSRPRPATAGAMDFTIPGMVWCANETQQQPEHGH
jgi:hypothetical protein